MRIDRIGCLAAAGSLLVFLSGCVTGPALAPVALAEIEVVNRTETALWIDVRGRVEATVPAGSRQRIRHLTAGEAHLRAYAAPGPQSSGPDERLQFDAAEHLTPGEITTWTVGAAIPAESVKGMGAIRVTNRVPRDLQVSLDGRPIGHVLSGDTRLFRDVAPGIYAAQAVDRSLKTFIERRVEVTHASVVDWEIVHESGGLQIINDTEEAVDLVMDDRALGRVAPGKSRSWSDLSPGIHELVGVSAVTRHRYQYMAEIMPGDLTKWGLTTGSAMLTISNHTTEKLTVVPLGTLVPSGARTFEVPPGGKETVRNVLPGLITLHAVGDRQEILYSTQVRLRAGQHFIWDVQERAATGRVINETTRELRIYVAGKERGALFPEGSMTLGDLPSGEFHVSAYTLNGNVYERFVRAVPREAFTWRVRSETGAVRIRNERSASVSVYQNAHFLGEIAPSDAVIFTGIPLGRQLFEAVDARDGQVSRHESQIAADSLVTLTVKLQRAFISVANDTGEELLVDSPWSGQHEVVRPGSQAHFVTGPGAKTLRLLGRLSGLHFVHMWEATVGEQETWRISKPLGSIRVLNELDESLALSVGKLETVELPAGGFRDFVGIPAGIYRLKAVGLESGRLYRENRRIQPDGSTIWRLALEKARILVINHDQSDLLIEIDEQYYGLVFAGTSKIFAGLGTGKRKLRATVLQTGSSRRFVLNLVGDHTDVLDIYPARGTLIVENASGEDIEVWFADGKVWPLAVDQEPTELPIDGGTHLIRVRRRDSQLETLYNVHVIPWRSIHLRVSRPTARIAVKNNTKQELEIWIGDRELGRVGPGEELISDHLAPGPMQLRARSLTRKITHAEQRILRAGSTTVWRLE